MACPTGQMTPFPCTLSPPMVGIAFMREVLQSLSVTVPYSWRRCTEWRSRPAWEKSTVCRSRRAPSAQTPLNLTHHRQQEGRWESWGQKAALASLSCPPRRALWRKTVAQQEKTQIPLPAARNTPSRSSRNRGNKSYIWTTGELQLSDCIPLCGLFLKKSFWGSLMFKWWHKLLPLHLFVGYNTYSGRLWTVGATSCSALSAYLVNVEHVGNG